MTNVWLKHASSYILNFSGGFVIWHNNWDIYISTQIASLASQNPLHCLNENISINKETITEYRMGFGMSSVQAFQVHSLTSKRAHTGVCPNHIFFFVWIINNGIPWKIDRLHQNPMRSDSLFVKMETNNSNYFNNVFTGSD